jgi:phosphorylated adapter RNA export protein
MRVSEKVTAGQIATVLREPCHILLARALRVLGPERCVELLTEALLIEHQGGMLLKDGSRKRTLGGVFLELCRQHSTAEEKRKIFR